jgi:hypothetical protein
MMGLALEIKPILGLTTSNDELIMIMIILYMIRRHNYSLIMMGLALEIKPILGLTIANYELIMVIIILYIIR